jgi:glycerophosphoryl diester phosphodiesterase
MVEEWPQVVAHRGASAVRAEHTLGAYVTALDEGADALECDVRLTADGHLVCVHDRNLRRTAKQGLEKLEKDGEVGKDDVAGAEKRLDGITKKHVDTVDDLLKHKEAELMEV